MTQMMITSKGKQRWKIHDCQIIKGVARQETERNRLIKEIHTKRTNTVTRRHRLTAERRRMLGAA